MGQWHSKTLIFLGFIDGHVRDPNSAHPRLANVIDVGESISALAKGFVCGISVGCANFDNCLILSLREVRLRILPQV